MLNAIFYQLGWVRKSPDGFEWLTDPDKRSEIKKRAADVRHSVKLDVLPRVGDFIETDYVSGLVVKINHKIGGDTKHNKYFIQLEKEEKGFKYFVDWETVSDQRDDVDVSWRGDWLDDYGK